VHHHSATDGLPLIGELPDLPDAPNCRCWSAPVLRPPEEFENDPAVRAEFQTAQGASVPDPAAYDQWFDRVDEGRRKMAVGARSYNTMKEKLAGSRPPEWTDFIQPDGRLLKPKQLREESEFERAKRKEFVRLSIRERENLLKQVSSRSFFSDAAGPRSPLRGGELRLDPPDAQLREAADRLTLKWRGEVTKGERQAVNRYVDDSGPINRGLRADLKSLSSEDREAILDIHRLIDRAGPLPEPTLLWRGVPAKSAAALEDQARELIGTGRVLELRGVQSFSTRPSTGAVFGEQSGVVLEVRARSGAYISGLSRSREDEVLHKHRKKYRVVAVREVEFGVSETETVSRTVVQLEEL